MKRIDWNWRSRRGCRSIADPTAFTLIELLTVVAILILLAAVGLPAIVRMRDNGVKAADLSNLRQIAAAVPLYVGENNGYYPTMHSGTGGPNGWKEPYWTDQITPYLARSDSKPEGRASVFYSPKFRDNHKIGGYGANSFVINLHNRDPKTGKPRAISAARIDQPSKRLLAASSCIPIPGKPGELQAVWFMNALTDPEHPTQPRPHPVHPGGTFAAVFCDGHAEAIAYDFYKENKELLVGPKSF